ncbi:signal peptidase I [Natronomonas sp.]|uniref:signal peptidase I n=1 Tax=Natronomonas sp. TaxID=2184060 RepID=UPI002607382B|nr:signal peptidase I [Natronomonas sp.]
MGLRSSAGSALTLLVVAVVLAMLVGQQLGQPILLGFVVTGSMSGTLNPGDGFVALPPAVADDIEEGDVITFEAREVGGGGLTTHRVEAVTDEGYITKGDANPFTDQDGPEPPVQDSQVVAVAWMSGGDPVRIPYIGTAALALQGALASAIGALSAIPGLSGLGDGNVGSVMTATGVLLLAYSFVSGVRSSGGNDRSRSRSRGGAVSAFTVLAVVILLIVGPATASMVIPSGTNEITIVSSESPSGDPTVIERGGTQTLEYNVSNDGYIPQVVLIEPASNGVDVSESTLVVSRGEQLGTTATIYAPDETGVYLRAISERQYLQLLPVSVIIALHGIHPFVAIAAIDLVIATAVTAVFVVAVGFEPLRFRSRDRNRPLGERIRRRLRRYF